MWLEALNVGPVIPVSDMAASRSFYEGTWFRDPDDQVISVFQLK
jgi:hypothetical protein